MHFWVARRHAAELPVEPVTFRFRSFLFRINRLPRCGSDVRPCTAVQLLGEVTMQFVRVAPRDETSRDLLSRVMLMQQISKLASPSSFDIEVYFEFCRLLRERGSAAVAQSQPFLRKYR